MAQLKKCKWCGEYYKVGTGESGDWCSKKCYLEETAYLRSQGKPARSGGSGGTFLSKLLKFFLWTLPFGGFFSIFSINLSKLNHKMTVLGHGTSTCSGGVGSSGCLVALFKLSLTLAFWMGVLSLFGK